jgi:hypothetical protein
LDFVPKVSRYDACMLSRIPLIAMPDLSNIKTIPKEGI